MNTDIHSILYQILAPVVKNLVYVQQTGLAAGLKRRGEFGFLPFEKKLSREHAYLKSLDFAGQTIYDVGGHIGLIAMFFARAAGEQGRVITFEPNPQNATIIRDHVAINYFTNIQAVPMGLGQKAEKLKFIVPKVSSARGTAAPDRQEKYAEQEDIVTFEIAVDTLDHLIQMYKLPKPDFIKIDIEGLELEALRGMAQTLEQHRPVLWIELHNTNDKEVARLLLTQRYHLFLVEQKTEITFANVDMMPCGHLYARPIEKMLVVGLST